MKIIKLHGTTFNEKVCPVCSCRFTYDDDDIEDEPITTGYENFKMVNDVRVVTEEKTIKYHNYYISCPECNDKIFLKRIFEDGKVITKLTHY